LIGVYNKIHFLANCKTTEKTLDKQKSDLPQILDNFDKNQTSLQQKARSHQPEFPKNTNFKTDESVKKSNVELNMVTYLCNNWKCIRTNSINQIFITLFFHLKILKLYFSLYSLELYF
jgi:uncharacterized protein (DUF342 family)